MSMFSVRQLALQAAQRWPVVTRMRSSTSTMVGMGMKQSVRYFSSSARGRPFTSAVAKTVTEVPKRLLHQSRAGGIFSGMMASGTMYTIMGINTAVFGLWQYSTSTNNHDLFIWLRKHFVNSRANLDQGRWYTMITSGLSHASFWHFAINTYGLYAFSQGVLAFSGPVGYLTLYIAASVGGALVHLASETRTADRLMRQLFPERLPPLFTSSLGASSFLTAVAAFYTCTVPRLPIMLLIFPMQIWVATAGLFAYDAYRLGTGARDGISHASHLGGMGVGVLAALAFVATRGRTPLSHMAPLSRARPRYGRARRTRQ
eukprot:m.48727 g.48727  ORF g.48727 m.48727 type:complete len:316 (+) comp11054_c0_seq1:269-1216(+)